VVLGHNFPFNEKYIYSFHMPLFILIAGFFHPINDNFEVVKQRFKHIILPYFLWAFILFIFWYILGRKYGDSATYNLSVMQNFIGIFYSQGGRMYMDWGIPLWFLPAIFITFLMYFFIKQIKQPNLQNFILISTIILGILYSKYSKFDVPFSINIAAVSLIFYAFGSHFFNKLNNLNPKTTALYAIIFGIINFFLFNLNDKVDMYRSIYGNELLFILNGFSGSLFILLLFKRFPVFKFLGFIGKFSMVILALQLLAMSVIKLFLWKVLQFNNFDFNEIQKFIFSIIQIIILIPSFLIINKFIPILNGGYKKI
jgi:acyltransferase